MEDLTLKNLILIQHAFGCGSLKAYNIATEIHKSNLLDKDISEIVNTLKFTDNIRLKLLSNDYSYANEIIRQCDENDIEIISFIDSEYPQNLLNIDVPPILLYLKGDLPDFSSLPSISVVGPRKPSETGEKFAYSISYRLSKAGFIVVSGGALGCDSSAHKGALSGGGNTVLVSACGILSDYLSENKGLRQEILKNGAIITEYPPKTEPTKFSFPVRNRIMAGLTLGTVIVEATEKSGALITARYALDYGRDVFVVPGNPTVKEYKGSNKLLRDGAKPLIDLSDVFNEYIVAFPDKIDIKKAYEKTENQKTANNIQKNSKILKETLSNEAKIVYNYLDKQVFNSDDLIGCGLSYDIILSALTELELENMIISIPGGNYKIK